MKTQTFKDSKYVYDIYIYIIYTLYIIYTDTNLGKPNVILIIIGWACSKMAETF